MNKNFTTLSKNTASNFFFFGVQQGLSLIEYAILFRVLTLDEFGILLFVYALMGQFNFLEGGLSVALEKYIPEYQYRKQGFKISLSVLATTLFFLLIGLLISLILIFLAHSGAIYNYIKVTDIESTNELIYVAAIFIPIMWGSKSMVGLLKGLNKFHLVNKIDTTLIILKFIITILVALISKNIFLIFIYGQIVEILKIIIYCYYSKQAHHFNVKKIICFRAIYNMLKEIFSYSIWVFIMQFSSMLMNQFDKVIVSIYLGVGLLPIYEFIMKLMKTLVVISGKLNSAIIPIASKFNLTHSSKSVNDMGLLGVTTVNALAMPMIVIVVVFAEPLLRVCGKSYLLEYIFEFQIGILIYALASSRSFLHRVLVASGDIVKQLTFFSISIAISYLLVIPILSKMFHLSGAILALPMVHLIFIPIWIFIVSYYAKVNTVEFLKAVVRGQLVSWVILIIYALISIVFTINLNNIFVVIFVFISLTTILAIATWSFILEEKLKLFIRKSINNLLKGKRIFGFDFKRD